MLYYNVQLSKNIKSKSNKRWLWDSNPYQPVRQTGILAN